jgi:hypothetical protein
MTTTFPAKRIAQLRRRASKAAELPEEVPEGWSVSMVDPMAVLAVFKPLRIKEGFVLRAYQFHSGGNGNGFIWAMPVDADFPDPEECPRLEDAFLEPPNPPAALHNVMDAIDGEWLFLSSANLTKQAFTINMELGMLVRGGSMPRRVEQQFERLIETDRLVRV